MFASSLSVRKRILWGLYISFIIFGFLIIKIGYVQILKGSELKAMAFEQQNLDRSINSKRGTIYDATRKKRFSCK